LKSSLKDERDVGYLDSYIKAMIHHLYIKDFALIDELEVEFGKGLNILTGQTGAGKSIIIGALNMILGERADTEVIRQGSSKAIAEASIAHDQNARLLHVLQEHDIEVQSPMILRREIRESGSRAFINDSPVTIGVLKQVGDLLVDLHGQYDHQLLLKEEHHLGVLDQFGKNEDILEAYRSSYEQMKRLRAEKRDLMKRESELQEKTELYRFQLQELEKAKLVADEEAVIEAEMHLLDNAELLDQKAQWISELGEQDEVDISGLLNKLKITLEDLARIEPEFEQYLEEVTAARVSIIETMHFAERYRDRIEFNPNRLEELRRRQSELNRLQKKYGKSIPELIEYERGIAEELSVAENFDLELDRLDEAILAQEHHLREVAIKLHESRQRTGEHLARSIESELSQLGIPHARLDVQVNWLRSPHGWFRLPLQPEEAISSPESVECTEEGADEVVFYLSTNKGEAPKALAKIASGGEISRVMLALKSVLAREQHLPVMIFDEIDTGISGEISEKVGQSMRKLSHKCQIIAITHQPQIASQAHVHFKVHKTERDNRTISTITRLNEHEHVQEVAGLMSGAHITDATLQSARELILNNQHNY
jgi:DNA repair protein RecN (Recombination protein N)